MQKTRHMRHSEVFAEINITPLTDIFLVLLIIMMVVAPILTQTRRDIVPPRITDGDELNQEALAIEAAADGTYYIDGTEVPESGIEAALAAREPSQAKKEVLVRADGRIRSEAMFKILRAAQAAHFEKVVVTGEITRLPEGKPDTGQ